MVFLSTFIKRTCRVATRTKKKRNSLPHSSEIATEIQMRIPSHSRYTNTENVTMQSGQKRVEELPDLGMWCSFYSRAFARIQTDLWKTSLKINPGSTCWSRIYCSKNSSGKNPKNIPFRGGYINHCNRGKKCPAPLGDLKTAVKAKIF